MLLSKTGDNTDKYTARHATPSYTSAWTSERIYPPRDKLLDKAVGNVTLPRTSSSGNYRSIPGQEHGSFRSHTDGVPKDTSPAIKRPYHQISRLRMSGVTPPLYQCLHGVHCSNSDTATWRLVTTAFPAPPRYQDPSSFTLGTMLTFWRRTFFFQILAHPVFKLWVIQKPNKVALWNKRHFEGEKMEVIQHV